MRARWRWLVGVVVLAAVAWRTGSGPFAAGVHAVDVPTLAVGTLLAAVTTTACAWRWHLVARDLGVPVAVPTAVVACYRAQLLNTVLPGGVLGDVHRAVDHGRSAGATGRALRAVAWERVLGQVVQAVVAALVLLALPSPVRGWLPAVLVVLVPVLGVVALAGGRVVVGHRSRWGVAAASLVAVAGHTATCLVAARAVGVTAPVSTLLPLVVLVLVGAGLPLNVAGWGPREGVAAWAFAAAGLGAGQGVAMSVAFGVMVLVANLPGLALLLVEPGSAARRPAGSGAGWRPVQVRAEERAPGLAAGGR